MSSNDDRPWTTLWDRTNRRVLLLAGQKPNGQKWWGSRVKHDQTASVPGVYDIWRDEFGDIGFAQIRLDDEDSPLRFPHDLLSDHLLGSMTLWPMPGTPSFIWWH